jgi:hypothetical protein
MVHGKTGGILDWSFVAGGKIKCAIAKMAVVFGNNLPGDGVAMVCDGINFYKEGVGVIGFCLTVSNCNARTCFVVDFDTAGFWFDVFVEGYSDFCG